jgi:endonuclease-3 related protein
MSNTLTEVYDRLYAAYGPQNWWPGESAFEILVGTILTQNTSWKNVEKAIGNLKDSDLLDPLQLSRIPTEELEELIRPAGYFRVKARRLHNLLQFVVQRYEGSLDEMFATSAAVLRPQLLGINGVGPETADSILLYAGQMPSFVVDTYTHRVLARHGWIGFEAGYEEIKDHFETALPEDVALFNEFHALLVRVGNLHCRKTPKCDGCPLADLLPDGGPLEADY